MSLYIPFIAATFLTLLLAAHSYFAYSYAPDTSDWGNQLVRTITSWYLWAAFFPVIFKLAEVWRFAARHRLQSSLVHLMGGLSIAIAHTILQTLILDWLLHPARTWPEVASLFRDQLITGLFWRFFIYQALLSICIAFHSYLRAKKIELIAAQMESKVLQTRIESLKAQLDPEFLFQSLHQLSRLMRHNFDRAESLVARLGRYLRMRLDGSKGSDTTLAKEMELMKCYLEIHNLKTGSNQQLEWNWKGNVVASTAPAGILQAWLDDVLRAPSQNPGPLRMNAFSENNDVVVRLQSNSITDNYPGLQQHVEQLNQVNRERLTLSVLREGEKSTVIIRIPLISKSWKAHPVRDPAEAQQPDSYMPVSAIRKWIVITVVFTAIALYFTTQRIIISSSHGTSIDWAKHLLDYSGWYIWALITPFVLKFSAKYPLKTDRPVRCAIMHFLAFLGCWVIATLAMEGVRWAANLGDYNLTIMLPLAFARSPITLDVICYATIIAVENSLRYRHRFESGKMKTARLSAQLSRAKLEILKTQLHPHFLFNSLNSLSELMQEDPSAAEKMIQNLEMFLRITLQENHVQEIPFEKEIQYLQYYLAIEKVRYQERLNIKMAIEPEVLQVPVPCLLLQPIVENAIRHGIASRATQDGRIEIRAKRKNGSLALSIHDNGPGMQTTRKAALRAGLGLSNTRERLKQLYGRKHRFDFINAPEGGLMVRLEIPALKKLHQVSEV